MNLILKYEYLLTTNKNENPNYKSIKIQITFKFKFQIIIILSSTNLQFYILVNNADKWIYEYTKYLGGRAGDYYRSMSCMIMFHSSLHPPYTWSIQLHGSITSMSSIHSYSSINCCSGMIFPGFLHTISCSPGAGAEVEDVNFFPPGHPHFVLKQSASMCSSKQ